MYIRPFVTATMLAVLVVGCGGESAKPAGDAPASPAAGATSTAPSATGKVITVEAITDEKGSYFKPAKIEAHVGDIVRFTLTNGVHNVNFLPDSNPGAKGLPKASEFLQLPGQTWDYTVDLAPGHYYFQCDPHALLGMKGHLEVEEKK